MTDDKPHRINFSNVENKFQMTKGDVIYLETEIIPKEAINKNVTFTSSDEKVLRVAGDGQLTAVNGGTATITASLEDGNYAECIVTVKHDMSYYNAVLDNQNEHH